MSGSRALQKLRKRQFEQAEQALADANREVDRLVKQRDLLRNQEREIVLPKRGVGMRLGAVVSQRSAMRNAIEAIDRRIEVAQQHREKMQERLKQAHIAYEQAKSIAAHILEKSLRKKARIERQRLDEIASQKFWRQKHSEREEKA